MFEIVGYTVEQNCPLGGKHLHDAWLVGGHAPQTHKSTAELLHMVEQGYRFGIEERDDAGRFVDEHEAKLVPCQCGTGYLLVPWVEWLERPLWPRKRKKYLPNDP